MSLFPELDSLDLKGLIEALRGTDPDADEWKNDDDRENSAYWSEVTYKIQAEGIKGVSFLTEEIKRADAARLRGIIFGLGCSKEFTNEFNFLNLLLPYLYDSRPMIVAETINSLSNLGFKEIVDKVLPFINHSSPYVVGSVLRFMSAHYPEEAIPLLLNALNSPDPIIRMNAVDELDDSVVLDAIPFLLPLLNDPDKDVQEATEGAMRRLGSHLEDRITKRVSCLRRHNSPYIASSALRFISRYEGEYAVPLLLDALQSPEPIIRATAVNELDNLKSVESISFLKPLLNDPEEDVRKAVQTVIKNLECCVKETAENNVPLPNHSSIF